MDYETGVTQGQELKWKLRFNIKQETHSVATRAYVILTFLLCSDIIGLIAMNVCPSK